MMLRNASVNCIVQLMVQNMSSYTFGSDIYLLSAKVSSNDLYFKIFDIPWFVYVLFLVIFVTVIQLFRNGSNRMRYSDVYRKNQTAGKNKHESLMESDSSE